MAASKVEKAMQVLADHFSGDEANYRNRELGAKLNKALGNTSDDDEPDADEPDATDDPKA